MTDVIVIGGGVIGCAVARELSKYSLGITVLEKSGDVATGTSKANSGIVHAGFDCKPGSVKAKMNIKGARMMPRLARDLDFRYKNNGAFVLCFDEAGLKDLDALKQKGEINGVKGLKIMTGDAIRAMEPNVSSRVIAGLHAPTGAITSPYEMTWAFAENAAENGVKFLFEKEVCGILRIDGGFELLTKGGETYTARAVVNAAGIHGDEISNLICRKKYKIIARKGEYCLLDKEKAEMAYATLFQLPTAMGKGVLVTPTAEGNLLLGPSSANVDDKENLYTTVPGLAEVFQKAALTMPSISHRDIITQFSGLRARLEEDDFVIKESAPYFFNAIGIESPGLSAAPAIGEYLAKNISKKLNAAKKDNFISKRKGIAHFADAKSAGRKKLIESDPKYGHVICRCETVTEAEIVESLHCRVPASDLDGVKRRTRAQTGRCQSGFCAPLILEIIARELGVPVTQVTKSGSNSNILIGKNKELDYGKE